MQKYLVVGCGGSGAKTQAFMIDQLKAYLRKIDPERTELPQAWQFVTIDVPLVPEKGPSGLANVEDSGGDYISIGSPQHYAQFDTGLSEQLGRSRSLGEIATWATRNPETLNTPISDGAGQYRGLGRMLTIQNLEKIHDGLRRAVDKLNETKTNNELNMLNQKITGRLSDKTDDQPVVLVISSMAGGAGASMFLDVCRVLSTLPTIKPAHTAVFMLTPEVFESLAASSQVGAWPNSLALFGEAMAAQTGAAETHDRAIFKAMGLPVNPQRTAFARLFPIGARMGSQGSRFGDGSVNAIYRGLARALAALIASDKASESFKSYTLANPGSIDVKRSYLGWGSGKVSWNDLPWGSMGYAQLSMGRDRYREYSAQRLARTTFDRLLTGHIEADDPSTGKEQLDKRMNEYLPEFFSKVFLPVDSGYGHLSQEATEAWLSRIFGGLAQNAANNAVGAIRHQLPLGDGMKSVDWANLVRSRLHDMGSLAQQLQQEGYSTVHSFADTLADTMTNELEAVLGRYGIPFVEALVQKLVISLQEQLVPQLHAISISRGGMNPVAPSPQLEALLAPLSGRGTVNASAQIADQIAGSYTQQLYMYYLVKLGEQLGPVLEDFRVGYLTPLQRSLDNLHQDLAREAAKKDVNVNLADVATSDPVAWPKDSDEIIDRRFESSANEILITRTDLFAGDYRDHLVRTMMETQPDLRIFDEAARNAAHEIITGQWDTQGAIKAPNNTLAPAHRNQSGPGNRAGWISKHLAVDPNGNGDRRQSRSAHFDIKLRPADLIERTRWWIDRPAKPFSNFISVDMRSYFTRDNAPNDAEYHDRLNRLREAFYTALRQARPLAAVSSTMLGAVHNVNRETYHFNFSEIPLESLEAAEALKEIVAQDRTKDDATEDTFNSSFTTDRKVFSIEVFGSYPNYSPVVFSSLFPHIAEDWASRHGNAEGFWNLRRARPLPAALPMTDEERQAMVAGWLIGNITGRIYVANLGQPHAAAHIWDDLEKEWVPFPPQMLTPPTKFQANIDWMPAVIESILLAYANVQSTPAGGKIGDSLRPYRLLRGIYDTGEEGPTTGAVQHSVVQVLAKWLATGEDPTAGTDGTKLGNTVDERYEAARKILMQAREHAAVFLPTAGRAALPDAINQEKAWANVSDRRVASRMPLYRDLAPDVDIMVTDLVKKLETAKDAARNWNPAAANSFQLSTPADDVDAGPDLPNFGDGVM